MSTEDAPINTFTRIPPDTREWLEDRARREGRSVSNMMARLLEQAREKDTAQQAHAS